MKRPETLSPWQLRRAKLVCLVGGHQWARSHTRRNSHKCIRCGKRVASTALGRHAGEPAPISMRGLGNATATRPR